MKQLHTLLARINRASLRERVLVFATAVMLLALGWNRFILQPIEARRALISESIETMRAHSGVDAAGRRIDRVAEQYTALKSRELALSAALDETDGKLREAQRGMIDPKEMVRVLTDVLDRQKNLKFVLLRNLPVQPLIAASTKSNDAAGNALANQAGATLGSGPFLHPVELVLRGDYLAVLAYLKEIEADEAGFQWRRFEFTTGEDGPEYRIQFMTLSMDSNWLGV